MSGFHKAIVLFKPRIGTKIEGPTKIFAGKTTGFFNKQTIFKRKMVIHIEWLLNLVSEEH